MFEYSDLTLISAFFIIAELVGILLALHVVMRPRSSQATIAWFIALITLPVITIPLYLTVGRTHFHGYAEAIRAKEEGVIDKWLDWYADMLAVAAPTKPGLAAIEAVVTRLTRIPFTRGNQAELLVDGRATYDAMLAAITSAETYLFVQFYIVRDDNAGRQLRDALIEKARSGVQVYFLYDEIGCFQLSKSYLDAMRGAAIHVSGFKTTKGRNNRFQINFRNHRKLLIIDGKTSFVGGHNLGDEYLGFRDTHMKIIGPASQHIQLSFLLDWYWATDTVPDVSKKVAVSKSADNAVAIVSTGPADDATDCSILFSSLFHIARKRLWITSPYFVPDKVMVRALQAAAIRGVDVRIILPAVADKKFIELASFTYYHSMIKCGIRLYRYRERFLHQKVILVDDSVAGIGTVNLDNRSMYLNFEVTGLVASKEFTTQVEAMLSTDLANSDEVLNIHYDAKPLPFRVAARVARLASPLL